MPRFYTAKTRSGPFNAAVVLLGILATSISFEPTHWKALCSMKDFAIAILIGVTVCLLFATPFTFLLIAAGEQSANEYYHWLSLIPLTVVVLLWFAILRTSRA